MSLRILLIPLKDNDGVRTSELTVRTPNITTYGQNYPDSPLFFDEVLWIRGQEGGGVKNSKIFEFFEKARNRLK